MKIKYKPSDWEIYPWPEPSSGDPKDYGPTTMQEEVFILHKKPWERPHNHTVDIVLFIGGAGSGKCWRKGTKVLMYDGTTKNVEDIVVGDLLMGPDSFPRTVVSLGQGREDFYQVTPVKGNPFFCNKSHILTLKKSGSDNETRINKSGKVYSKPGRYGKENGEVVNVSIEEYLTWSRCKQKAFKLYRSEAIQFPLNQSTLPIPPYIFGLWLGDGNSEKLSITTMDDPIYDSFIEYSIKNNFKYRLEDQKSKAINIHINGTTHLLDSLSVRKNKHIPLEYKTSSIENRQQLLAGLIDSDGYLAGGYYEITQKNVALAEDIAYVARSLGLAAYVKKVNKSCNTSKGKFTGEYYKVSICGDVSQIPVRLERKKASPRNQKKNALVTGFSLSRLPEEDYYGFTLGEDPLFLLGDFTVAHNTTTMIAAIIELLLYYKNCTAVVGGKNMPLLKRNVMDDFGKRLSWKSPDGITHWWKHPTVLKAPAEKSPFAKFFNQASLRFLNIDDPEIVRGFTADVFGIDEINLMNADSFKEMLRRSRGNALPVRQFILGMNPTGARDWVYDMFVLRQFRDDYKGDPIPIGEPCECQYCHVCSASNLGKFEWVGGEKKIGPNGVFYEWSGGECPNPECPTLVRKGTPQTKTNCCPGNQHYYRVIRSHSLDNPHLPSDFAQLQKSALSAEEYATFVEGKIVDLNTGYIYKEFSDHNIAPGKLDPNKPIYWTHDFNFDPMCSYVCQETETGLHVVDELTLWNSDELDVAKYFVGKYKDFKNKVILYGDPNGVVVTSRADSNKVSFVVLRDFLKSKGFDVEIGVKKVKNDTLIPIIDRVKNLKVAILNGDQCRKIFIDPSCKNLIESLRHTAWKEKSPSPKEDDSCDALAKTNPKRYTEAVLMTHPQAALGYLVYRLFPVLTKKQGIKLLVSHEKVVSSLPLDKSITVTKKNPVENKSDPFEIKSISSELPHLSKKSIEERLKYQRQQEIEYYKQMEEAARIFFSS